MLHCIFCCHSWCMSKDYHVFFSRQACMSQSTPQSTLHMLRWMENESECLCLPQLNQQQCSVIMNINDVRRVWYWMTSRDNQQQLGYLCAYNSAPGWSDRWLVSAPGHLPPWHSTHAQCMQRSSNEWWSCWKRPVDVQHRPGSRRSHLADREKTSDL